MNRYYFDHNATTPPLPEIARAFAEAAAEAWGNPSSVHRDGQHARSELEQARVRIAALFACSPKDIVLTSGGTEAANLAVLGSVRAVQRSRKHVITTAIEHPAVLQACAQLEREGVEVTRLPVNGKGLVAPADVHRALQPHTVLVSTMHVNNETGVIQPLDAISPICCEAGVMLHSDGVQAAGKLSLLGIPRAVDLYSISAHKLYAPKGAGALYVRQGIHLQPLVFGGRHELGRRAGTENVPGAIALGAAAEAARNDMEIEMARLGALRDRLENGVLERVPQVTVNGAGAPRVATTTNLCFDGIDGEAMVIALDLKGFAVSTGAACSSGAVEPSHVLLAMGLSRDEAKSSIRFSLGRSNDEAQVDALIEAVAAAAAHLRRLSPTYTHA